MAVSLRFYVRKYIHPHQPDPTEYGYAYRAVHDENLLPSVVFGVGEQVIASVQCSICTLVLTNARIIRGRHSGLDWGRWWELKSFGSPSKKVEDVGGTCTATIIPTAFLEFTNGTVMKFDDVNPSEASFLFTVAGIAKWVIAQLNYPGRVPQDVGILYDRQA